MDEIRNETYVEEIENTEVEVYDDLEVQENEGSGVIGKLVVGSLVGGAVIALVANRKKIAKWFENRKIRSLEKKGYVVSIPCEDEDNEDREEESYESEVIE